MAAAALLDAHALMPITSAADAQHYAMSAVDPATGKMCEYGALLKGSEGAEWTHATALEFGRLAQGVGTEMPTG